MAFAESPLTKTFQDVKWKLVYYHDVSYGYWKEDRSDIHQSNQPGKYSIFGLLHNGYRIDGRFEFLLEYPDGFNRWQQRNNPIKEFKESGKKIAKNYAELNCSFHDNNWGGLVRSSSSCNAYIDGSVLGSSYFYAIGTTKEWFYGNIPGPKEQVSLVKLWVRLAFESCQTLKKSSLFISKNLMLYILIV